MSTSKTCSHHGSCCDASVVSGSYYARTRYNIRGKSGGDIAAALAKMLFSGVVFHLVASVLGPIGGNAAVALANAAMGTEMSEAHDPGGGGCNYYTG